MFLFSSWKSFGFLRESFFKVELQHKFMITKTVKIFLKDQAKEMYLDLKRKNNLKSVLNSFERIKGARLL